MGAAAAAAGLERWAAASLREAGCAQRSTEALVRPALAGPQVLPGARGVARVQGEFYVVFDNSMARATWFRFRWGAVLEKVKTT